MKAHEAFNGDRSSRVADRPLATRSEGVTFEKRRRELADGEALGPTIVR
jgi:hypothetical protein